MFTLYNNKLENRVTSDWGSGVLTSHNLFPRRVALPGMSELFRRLHSEVRPSRDRPAKSPRGWQALGFLSWSFLTAVFPTFAGSN